MAATTETEWFYATAQGERLKCTFAEMAQLLKDNTISNATLVWNATMDEWKLLADLPDVYESLVLKNDAGPAEWHYVHTGTMQQTGPVTAVEFKSLLASGAVNPTSLVWKPSLPNWTPLSQVTELSSVIGEEKVADSGPAEWFYVDLNREKKGPITLAVLKTRHAASLVAPTSLVWKAGMREWIKLELCSEPAIVEMVEQNAKLAATEEKKRPNKSKKKKKWTTVDNHGNIYVTGLPVDVTEEELSTYFTTCGVIKTGLDGKPKIKVYRDKKGQPKGDGLVSFVKEESVGLAVTLHDGAPFRDGVLIGVQKAEFQQKGDYKAKSLSTAEKEALAKAKMEQNKKLGWHEGEQTLDKRRIVVLKYMFTPQEALTYPNFYGDLRMEVGMEVERKCGRVEKLTVFEGSPEGVIAIKFEEPQAAEACIEQFDGRFFSFRQLSAEYFDGTDYRVKETEEEKQARIKAFGEWLQQQQQENDAAQADILGIGNVRKAPASEAESEGGTAKRAKTSES